MAAYLTTSQLFPLIEISCLANEYSKNILQAKISILKYTDTGEFQPYIIKAI